MEYSVEISDFSGPLDLLLHLIDKAKIDIKNIFVSEITEQYLNFVSTMKEQDMELSSEFVSMAATLLFIKSRSILPRHNDDEEAFDEEYEKQLIINRLEEYKSIKNVTQDLKAFEKKAANYYTKLPEEIISKQILQLDDVNAETLYKAFIDIMQNKKEKSGNSFYNYVLHDKYTVEERIEHIKTQLLNKKKLDFYDLFDDAVSKIEVVVTFCAVLELLNQQIIKINQSSPFNNIILLSNDKAAL